MTTFEFRLCSLQAGVGALNALGADGWHVVGTAPGETLIMQRDIAPPPTPEAPAPAPAESAPPAKDATA